MGVSGRDYTKMNDRLKALIIMGLFVLAFVVYASFVSSQDYDTHEKETDYELLVSSNNATQCNLTYIKYANNTKTFFNQVMTKTNQDFNKTIKSGNFTQLGIFCMGMTCTDGSTYEAGSKCIEVTYTGEKFSMERTYIYIVGLIFLVLLSLSLVFIISKLPASDVRSEDGLILQVSMLKHFRPVLWIVVWGIALACFFIISNLGIAYLNDEMMGKLFFNIFQVMFWFTIIGVPVYFIYIFYKIFADKETQRLIERGVEIRTP